MRRRSASGLRARLLASWLIAAEKWPAGGPVDPAAIAALRTGVPLLIDTHGQGDLFPASAPRHMLLTEANELIPVEPVFWPGDGTANLYTGSRSLRNYRLPDESMVHGEDLPRIARDGTRYVPEPAERAGTGRRRPN